MRKNSRKDLPAISSTPAVSSPPVSSPPNQRSSNASAVKPVKSRSVVRNRESLDLDDVMGDSGDEDSDDVVVLAPQKRQTPHTVSPITRDLMDFLADGPPDSPPSGNQNIAPSETPKSKSNRLQKMMSKLYIGTERQGRPNAEETTPKSSYRGISSPVGPSLQNKTSLSSLANNPVPPRFPPVPPPSPPGSSEDVTLSSQSPLKHSVPRKSLPAWEQKSLPSQTPPASKPTPPPVVTSVDSNPGRGAYSTTPKTTTALGAPVTKKDPSHKLSLNDARDIRRLMAKATNADECRIIFDMLLAKCGVPVNGSNQDNPYPSPLPSDGDEPEPHGSDVELKHSLLELLLGGDGVDSVDDTRQIFTEDILPPPSDVHIGDERTITPPAIDKDTHPASASAEVTV
jgi:hypothetical protein